MGRKCGVPGCLSEEGRSEDRGVTFHKVPVHPDIRPKWMSLCHIPEDKQFVKVIHVCSRHFLNADFCQFKGRRYMLRQGVLPTVFPWSNYVKKETNENSNSSVSKLVDQTSSTSTVSLPGFNEQVAIPSSIKQNVGNKTKTVPLDPNVKEEVKQDPSKDKEEMNNELGAKKVVEHSSTTIEQKGKSIETSSGVLNFATNTRLEALDFNGSWFPARIIEIDYEESEVLIHFEKYSSKYDEWISMDSCRLRPLQQEKKIPVVETFSIGEKCLASWSDARKFPATITKIIDKDSYEVTFNDGFVKILKGHRIAKADGKFIGSAPLFEPVEGSKQDRRDKKRKLNVAQLFQKRIKTEVDESSPSHTVSVEEPVVTEDENDVPRWENGRPVGIDSKIETNDGVKKSIIVTDPKLPPNWQKHLTQRVHGVSAGKWETVLLSPDGRKFRTKGELKSFMDENPHLNYNMSMFDLSLHRRNSRQPKKSGPQIEPPIAPPVLDLSPQIKEEPPEDNTNNLKILLVDDAYKCPIEGCGKNFRRENLAQMHVKHYHPEYTKFLDSTPNVADLAYARTVGESLDKSPERNVKHSTPKTVQKNVTSKPSTPKTTMASPLTDTEFQCPQTQIEPSIASQKSKDSEILKLLNNKSVDSDVAPKYPPGLPSNMYPDIKLKDLLTKSEGIPKRDDTYLKNLSANRPMGIKTLLPVVRTNEIKQESEPEQKTTTDANISSKTPVTRQSLKRKRRMSDSTDNTSKNKEIVAELAPLAPVLTPQPDPSPGYIMEGGQMIKIVRMKSEEIINCICGITEEDGLMIQCEVCLCWQHAYCNSIQFESQVPDNYICYICQNPIKQRFSKRYFHDQDWLKNGNLPVASYRCKDDEVLKKRFETLKISHDLTGRLIELKDFMQSLKVKLKIADMKNHPKLYLWSKQWDKPPLPEKFNALTTSSINQLKLKVVNSENQLMSKMDLELLNNKNDSQNDSMLLSLLKPIKEESKYNEDELSNLLDSNLSQLPIPAPIIPQPEAAIENADCKLNILDHITHYQNLVEERLNEFEDQIDTLEEIGDNNEKDWSHTCLTLKMLLKDLSTLHELSNNNSL